MIQQLSQSLEFQRKSSQRSHSLGIRLAVDTAADRSYEIARPAKAVSCCTREAAGEQAGSVMTLHRKCSIRLSTSTDGQRLTNDMNSEGENLVDLLDKCEDLLHCSATRSAKGLSVVLLLMSRDLAGMVFAEAGRAQQH